MQSRGRPILVTGAIRSGSTWVGKMLAQAADHYYVHEPFNPSLAPQPGFERVPVHHWFEHVSPANEAPYQGTVAALVGGRYRIRRDPAATRLRGLRMALRRYRRYQGIRHSGQQPVLKDPLAVFAAEWLASRFDADVVITIRHPAAFVSSVRRLEWPIDHAREILDQKDLMARYLYPYEAEIARSRVDDDLIDQAALTWKLVYHVVSEYQARYPNWHFVHHEDLSRDPEGQFEQLYGKLGLPFDARVADAVRAHSAAGNVKEIDVHQGDIKHTSSIVVDSRENVHSWRSRLTQSEVSRIYDRVGEVADRFYARDTWT